MRWQKNILLLLLSLSIGILSAQQGNNPFDQGAEVNDSLSQSNTNPFDLDHRSANRKNNYNPFDVSRPKQRNLNRLEDISRSPIATKPLNVDLSNFNFILFSGILILFTFLFTLYQPLLSQIYKSVRNENILKLLHREQIGIVKAPYIIWYLFFFISLAAFILQLVLAFYPEVQANLWGLYLRIVISIAGIFFLKHLVLLLLGLVFPVKKELGLYSFTIIIFNIIVGLALIPINLILAFGPVLVYKSFIFIGLGIIVILIALGVLRILLMTLNKWTQFIFHFFIYLCAVEIAPIIVLLKLVISS